MVRVLYAARGNSTLKRHGLTAKVDLWTPELSEAVFVRFVSGLSGSAGGDADADFLTGTRLVRSFSSLRR